MTSILPREHEACLLREERRERVFVAEEDRRVHRPEPRDRVLVGELPKGRRGPRGMRGGLDVGGVETTPPTGYEAAQSRREANDGHRAATPTTEAKSGSQ